MATIALIAAYDAPSKDRAVLLTGSELARLCRTFPENPETVDLGKLYFLLTDGGLARDTFHTLSAGVSSTWNPKPEQLHVGYTRTGTKTYDFSRVLTTIREKIRADKTIAVIANREEICDLLIAFNEESPTDCLEFIGQGFPSLPGEMITIDFATRCTKAFDPRASWTKE